MNEEKLSELLNKTRGLRKIKGIKTPCNHPEHYPPNNIVLEPGVYEHVCPACGARFVFEVPYITCSV